MNDDDYMQRAFDNGWTQLVDATDRWPGSERYPWTGWLINGVGNPVVPGKERIEWVGVGNARHKVTYIDSWDRLPRERLDHDDRCGECGKRVEYGGFFGYEVERAPLPYCWGCQFWIERLTGKRQAGRPATSTFVAETNGVRNFYGIGTATKPSSHNGFSGRWFGIQFDDGRTIRTCDLWSGGAIPERFHDRFPVTARFATTAKATA